MGPGQGQAAEGAEAEPWGKAGAGCERAARAARGGGGSFQALGKPQADSVPEPPGRAQPCVTARSLVLDQRSDNTCAWL